MEQQRDRHAAQVRPAARGRVEQGPGRQRAGARVPGGEHVADEPATERRRVLGRAERRQRSAPALPPRPRRCVSNYRPPPPGRTRSSSGTRCRSCGPRRRRQSCTRRRPCRRRPGGSPAKTPHPGRGPSSRRLRRRRRTGPHEHDQADHGRRGAVNAMAKEAVLAEKKRSLRCRSRWRRPSRSPRGWEGAEEGPGGPPRHGEAGHSGCPVGTGGCARSWPPSRRSPSAGNRAKQMAKASAIKAAVAKSAATTARRRRSR